MSAIASVVPAPFRRKIKSWIAPHDMERLVRKLERHGADLSGLDALEVFARDGRWHTRFYADKVKTLECWELFEEFRDPLQRNLPNAKVKIVNSFEEIRRTPLKYGFVVVDNPIYGDPKDRSTNCEHFDLFPDVFRVLADDAILVLSVIPFATPEAMSSRPELFSEEHLEARKHFYLTPQPQKVSHGQMLHTYTRRALAAGFVVKWHVIQPRAGSIAQYLALKFRRDHLLEHDLRRPAVVAGA